MSVIAETPGRYCPSCQRHLPKGFEEGKIVRERCPRCRAFERHRFFALLVGALSPQLSDVDVLLDIAPAPQARRVLQQLEPRAYVRLDLESARGVDVRGDITALPFADGCVDLLVCYHVLEHIPDDRAAMAELSRVLAPDGLGILQVPWRPGTVTDEDPDAPEEERIRRFGLAEHVRYYGDDVEDRLVAAGLDVVRVTPADFLGEEANTMFGLGTNEEVWLVSPAGSGRAATARTAIGPTHLTVTVDALISHLAKVRLDRRDARSEVRRLQAEVDRLTAEQSAAPEPADAPAGSSGESATPSGRRLLRRR